MIINLCYVNSLIQSCFFGGGVFGFVVGIGFLLLLNYNWQNT